MKTFNYIIKDKEGIHARPAGMVVKAASGLKSDITIVKGEKSGDAKRIFAVMGLGVKCGDEITVNASGEDENTAIEAIEKVFKENL